MSATEQQLEIRTKVAQLNNLVASIPNIDPTTQQLVRLAVSITSNFWTRDVANGTIALTALDELIDDLQKQLSAARAGNPAFADSPGTSGANGDEPEKENEDPVSGTGTESGTGSGTGSGSEAKAKDVRSFEVIKANPRVPPSEEIQRLIQNIRNNAFNDVESNPFKNCTAQEVETILEMFMEVKDPVHLLGILRAVSAMVDGDELTEEKLAGFMAGMEKLGDKNPVINVLIRKVTGLNERNTKASKGKKEPTVKVDRRQRQTRDASGSPRRCATATTKNRRSPDSGKCRRSSGAPKQRRPNSCSHSEEDRRRNSEMSSSGGRTSRRRGATKSSSRKRRADAKAGSRRTPRRAASQAKKSRRSSSSASGASRGRRSESGTSRGRRSESGASRRRRSESGDSRGRRSKSGASRGRRSESGASRRRRSESGASRRRRSESSTSRGRRSESGASRRRRSESGASRRRGSESGTSRRRRSESGDSRRRRSESGSSNRNNTR